MLDFAAHQNWAAWALDRVRSGEPGVLVTVLATEGSAPRDWGAKMVVWRSSQSGTIGGGNLEYQVTDQARRMIDRGDVEYAIQDYPLGPLLAQCCGGRVRLLLERLDAMSAEWLQTTSDAIEAGLAFAVMSRFDGAQFSKTVTVATDGSGRVAPGIWVGQTAITARGPIPSSGDVITEVITAAPTLLIFGAGHIGCAIKRTMTPLPFRILWFDSRAEAGDIAGVTTHSPEALSAEINNCRLGAYILILTHDHALDYALVLSALKADRFSFLGLIGSRTKKARFLSRLRGDGVDEARLRRLTCPIGLPQLKGKAPETIALSVAADLSIRLQDNAILHRPSEISPSTDRSLERRRQA